MLFRHAVKPVQRAVFFKTKSPTCHTIASIKHCYQPQQQRCYRTRTPSKPEIELQDRSTDTLDRSSLFQHDESLAVDATSAQPVETKEKKLRKPRAKKQKDSPVPTSALSRVTAISQNHHDLESFLAYADSANVSRTSNVYLGTHYEYKVSASLRRLGFALDRVGGASDLGIDLIGHWNMPSLSLSIPAVVQCKATAPGAVFIRELEGAMQSAPPAWKQDNAIGLLAAAKPATKGVRDALARSALPMAFLCITVDEGHVKQFIWNHAAVAKCGLEGVGASLRYPEETIALTSQGEPLGDLSAGTRA